MIDFAHLIAPLEAAVFFRQYWERAPLSIARNDAAHYADLLTVAEIDRHIFGNQNLAPDLFRFFRGKDEAKLPPSHVVDHAQAFALLEQGYGIYLNFPERVLPPLRAFFRRLSAALNVQAVSHLIVSPPNAPGFLPHTDPYGVFVLQIAGEKTWYLYDIPESPAPAVGRNYHQYAQRPPAQTVVVRAGDLLYLPRGMVHAVATTHSHSVHLSLALTPPTGADLARLLFQSLADDPVMRDYAPFGLDGESADQLAYAQTFKQRLAEALERADLFALLERAQQARIRQESAVPSLRRLLARDQLQATSLVQIKPGQAYQLVGRMDRCVLRFANRQLEFPAVWQAGLEDLFARRACRVGELGRALPITDAERVQAARNLLQAGFLEVVEDDDGR